MGHPRFWGGLGRASYFRSEDSGLGLERFDDFEEVGSDGAGFGDGIGDGDAGDLGAFEDYELAEVSCVNEIDGGYAVAGG